MNFFARSLLCWVLLLFLFCASLCAQPQTVHPFAILPIYDGITGMHDTPANAAKLQREMDRLKAQIGQNNGRFRVGFSHVFGNPQGLLLHCRLATQNDLSVGVIIAVQTHTRFGEGIVQHDLRCAQWRMDGRHWQGEQQDRNDNVQFPTRDWMVPTPSRYCSAIHDKAIGMAQAEARAIHEAMLKFPGVIVAVNAVIEEELASGGAESDNMLADYSPFAITEFRDWLCHRGKYDALTGEYAGQGAPADIVGPYLQIRGALRSPFYDDPSPDRSNHAGPSFNQWFGTSFNTWSLRYWDLQRFPKPITDTKFAPSPTSGVGYTSAGFDAPRHRDAANKYWNAWSWDIPDHHGQYPPGNPAHPAFGFRQMEIAHFVSDVLSSVQRTGIPANQLYAHQIPGEFSNSARFRSGADPIWTAYFPAGGTLGITRFGPLDVNKLTQYSHNWGIFEWHPNPLLKPTDPRLYQTSTNALNLYSSNGCQVLFPGWWNADAEISKIFPLDDSLFARAIHDWLAAQTQQ
ncbi:MAG TPA: hypothetical protein VGG19_03445 [Tepidisphaeraceae bacterium]|jgi:hypothetical protein